MSCEGSIVSVYKAVWVLSVLAMRKHVRYDSVIGAINQEILCGMTREFEVREISVVFTVIDVRFALLHLLRNAGSANVLDACFSTDIQRILKYSLR